MVCCLCYNYLTQISLFQLRPAWIIPFFCYQIFDFALNTLVAVSIVVYPNTIQDYLQQLVRSLGSSFPRQVKSVLFLLYDDMMTYRIVILFYRHYFSYTWFLTWYLLPVLARSSLCPSDFPSLITSLTKRRLLPSATCAWFSSSLCSSAVYLPSR